MLVLTRKVGERILVGDDIVITVLDSRGDGVRIGIDAPRGVKIQREEVVRAVAEANAEAAAAGDDAEAQLRAALGARSGAAADGPTPSGPTES
ncbi:carbon storage regulator CsrA [Curtobacterium sp. BRB10]|uniref:carbon storage regulator CsrA n=1 Tax=Curtobacterium sp. BRB10 TaxID=2962579 RepID=UPI0028818898|nr:carbon storage regulator CsrA [Curtobacterium sp. BRB10]MDT0233410.1 carbon storage regulator CsrA [Curtobacterium sp. BRB10]